jgi:hypothetical protein
MRHDPHAQARIDAMFPPARPVPPLDRLRLALAIHGHDIGAARRRHCGRVSREWVEACARYHATKTALECFE